MDELLEIREFITAGRYSDALLLIDDLDEMAKDDKFHKIRSFSLILLIHLIKQSAENRTTKSWDNSIKNAVEEIQLTNNRRNAKGFYASEDELKEIIENAYKSALRYASQEAFGGVYSDIQLGAMIDKQQVLDKAFELTQIVE